MNIAMIAALEGETEKIKQFLGNLLKTESIGETIVEIYRHDRHTIYFSHCGVGTIKSAITATALLSRYSIDLILNFGTAGAVNPNISRGSLLTVNSIYFYEFGAAERENLLDIVTFEDPRNQNIFNLSNPYVNWFLKESTACKSACGNKFICNDAHSRHLYSAYGCDICEMESVGIYLAAEHFHVPCVFIKTTSDFANSNAEDDFNSFILKGVTHYCDILAKFLNEF